MNLFRRSPQRAALLFGCVCVSFVLSASSLSNAWQSILVGLTDTLPHMPPTSGTYGYNSFVPANTPGASYVDPVFGSTIRRLSTDNRSDDIYAKNMWWNADGTKFAHGGQIVNTATGQQTHTVPRGSITGDAGFDPVDPNVYYYYSGSTIRKVVLNSGGTTTESTFFTASASLQSLGSSVNWWSADGKLFLVKFGSEPSIKVYEKTSSGNVLYGGAINGSSVGNGWIGLTPSGKHVMGYVNSYSPYGMGSAAAWDIDSVAKTVGPINYFWALCGDHAVPISATDGKDYLVVGNCYSQDQIVRASPDNNAQNFTTSTLPTAPGNKVLKSENWQNEKHFSSVGKGPLRDWVFVSMECGSCGGDPDNFNSVPSNWPAYRQEIVGINVLTGEIRRIAHHRSRNLSADYGYQPRLSVSWGGEYVGWASNMNQSGTSNIFAATFGGPGAGSGSGGGTGGGEDTTAPAVSVVAPGGGSTLSGNVTVTASASDDVGVASVQFKLNGANLGSLITNGTYSLSWNTASGADGSYAITAVARDAAGNSTTSSAVNVTVNNAPAPTAPVISAVSASNISTASATIGWQTNQASDTQVEYGTTASYGSQTALNTTMVSSHSAALSGLAAGTTYHFRVKSKNSSGLLTTSGDFTFATAAPAPTAPVISGVSASSMTTSSALIAWQTNQSSDTQVEFGTTTGYGSQSTLDTTMVSSHSRTLSGLSAGTSYHYRVKSKNSSGMLSTSGDFTFATTAAPPPTPTSPVISGVAASNISTSSATIGWQTDQASDTQVEFGTTTSYGSQSQLDTTMVSSHSRTLSGLSAGTTYQYRVKSRNSSGLLTTSGNFTFATTAAAPPTPTGPVISGVTVSSITTSGAVVTWQTNQPSDTQVQYGTTTNYGSQTWLNTTMVSSHSRTLSNLSEGTTYHYRVKSKNSSGELATSGDFTFTTTSTSSAVTLWNVQATRKEGTTYIITWNTSVPANSRIEYGTTTSYGQMTFLDTDVEATHWELLPNLNPYTTYHYRVISVTPDGVKVVSADQVLTTGSRY